MFFGEFEHTLDDKGRVFLPARHREELGEVVMAARGVDGQIDIYPVPAWQALAEKVGGENQAHAAVRDMSRIFYAASECPVDKQGRIVLPNALRRHAGLDTEVVLVGVKNHLEIWSRENWERLTSRLLSEGSAISEQVATLGVRL